MTPKGYWSCLLTRAKQALESTQKTFLAIIWSVLLLRLYQGGTLFNIRTDHDSFYWIQNYADTTGKLAQCQLHLCKFQFDVIHRAGIEHQAADALP